MKYSAFIAPVPIRKGQENQKVRLSPSHNHGSRVVPFRASAAPTPPPVRSARTTLSRRAFLTFAASCTGGAALASFHPNPLLNLTPGLTAATAAETGAPSGPFALPPLPYSYNALEPHISEQIMRYHHDAHFNSYVNNLNAAITSLQSSKGVVAPATDAELKQLLANLGDGKISDAALRTKLRNNGGGYLNHKQFFAQLSGNPRELSDDSPLAAGLKESFGSFDGFKEKFLGSAASLFGSGFTWLVLDKTQGGKSAKLAIVQTPNQDNPVMNGMTPILACDCWEHAWYTQYGPKKAGYFVGWWKVIDWAAVNETYVSAVA